MSFRFSSLEALKFRGSSPIFILGQTFVNCWNRYVLCLRSYHDRASTHGLCVEKVKLSPQEKTVEITELKAKLHDKANVEEHLASANNKISEYERQVILSSTIVTTGLTALLLVPSFSVLCPVLFSISGSI